MSWFLFITLAVFGLLIPTAYAGWIGAPYAPTRLAAVKKAFDYIRLGEGDTLIDLGAGDGKIVRAAAARGAAARGIELSPIMWAVAWFWTLFFTPPVKGERTGVRPRIIFGNFYQTTLADATIIFAFLMPATMPRVRQWLASQSVPRGKYFLAYAFPFKEVVPLHVVKVAKCAPVYIYHLSELTRAR